MLGALGVVSCFHNVSGQNDPEGPLLLVVDNRSVDDIVMYMVSDAGQRWRIGDAAPLHLVKLQVASATIRGIGLVQFIGFRPTGDYAGGSERIRPIGGDTVRVIIPQ